MTPQPIDDDLFTEILTKMGETYPSATISCILAAFDHMEGTRRIQEERTLSPARIIMRDIRLAVYGTHRPSLTVDSLRRQPEETKREILSNICHWTDIEKNRHTRFNMRLSREACDLLDECKVIRHSAVNDPQLARFWF